MCDEKFPDGTVIEQWFYDSNVPQISSFKNRYVITDFGVKQDGKIYTDCIQKVIDLAFENGGGIVVVPKGVYLSGALFFKQGVSLYLEEGGMLKGSDDISDYPLLMTRIEGETCLYYSALINACGLDEFSILGEGTIDGNGKKSWKAFFNRTKWNPDCTNKDEQRARLIFLDNCRNVNINGVKLQNSQFWTMHLYRCQYVKIIGCYFYSPSLPIAAPSTDAIDIDVCSDVLIKNCYMEVNDDAVVLKGGKGPWADQDKNNGVNERILVEDCEYGFCHSCFTCGSESIHNKNILVRRIKLNGTMQLAFFKLRPDTPQCYEHIIIEDVTGSITDNFININLWTQFFNLKGRKDKPKSKVANVVIRNCDCDCAVFFNVAKNEKEYVLSNFSLENLKITAINKGAEYSNVRNIKIDNVEIRCKNERN